MGERVGGPLRDECRCQRIKKNGERCNSVRFKGSKFCGAHGAGRNLPVTIVKHGLYSKFMPRNIKGAYEAAMQDQELLSLRSGVAVVETRVCELLSQLSSDNAADLWRQLVVQKDRLQQARLSMNEDGVLKAIHEIEAIVTRGATQQQKWDELFRALTLKKELAASEWKRLVDMRQTMTAEQAFLLMSAVVHLIIKHVADEPTKRKLCFAIQGLAGNDNPAIPFKQRTVSQDSMLGVPLSEAQATMQRIEDLKEARAASKRPSSAELEARAAAPPEGGEDHEESDEGDFVYLDDEPEGKDDTEDEPGQTES